MNTNNGGFEAFYSKEIGAIANASKNKMLSPVEDVLFFENPGYDLETLKIVKVLETDPFFEQVVKDIRAELGIPLEGLDPNSTSSQYPIFIKEIYKTTPNSFEEYNTLANKLKCDIQKKFKKRLGSYRIPKNLFENLYTIVIDNTVTSPVKYIMNIESDRKEGGVQIEIKIKTPMRSCNPIVEELKENWDDVIKLLVKFGDEAFVDSPKIENIDIWSLREKKGLKFKVIAEQINEKYKINIDTKSCEKRYRRVKGYYEWITSK